MLVSLQYIFSGIRNFEEKFSISRSILTSTHVVIRKGIILMCALSLVYTYSILGRVVQNTYYPAFVS